MIHTGTLLHIRVFCFNAKYNNAVTQYGIVVCLIIAAMLPHRGHRLGFEFVCAIASFSTDEWLHQIIVLVLVLLSTRTQFR